MMEASGLVFSELRRFARPRAAEARCDFCSVGLGKDRVHLHLLDTTHRGLRCACAACATVLGGQGPGRWRRIEPRAEALTGFRLTDAAWTSLGVPITIAFFVRSSPDGEVTAFYPSPAGVVASPVPPGAWTALVNDNPALLAMEPDVEALLVNRHAGAHRHYRVSIDECYRLVGLIRLHWRGVSGGAAWAQVEHFFEALGTGV